MNNNALMYDDSFLEIDNNNTSQGIYVDDKNTYFNDVPSEISPIATRVMLRIRDLDNTVPQAKPMQEGIKTMLCGFSFKALVIYSVPVISFALSLLLTFLFLIIATNQFNIYLIPIGFAAFGFLAVAGLTTISRRRLKKSK